ncbi:MAG: corrinoid protein [Candidatus Heimdallarchaeota archaeon]|nr:corrinoid protein [Candidatus Heimdallarchaeota archaeon]
MSFLNDYQKAILTGDKALAQKLASEAIAAGMDIPAIVDAFSEAIRKAGDLFEEGEFFLPELMRSAEAMKAAMAILEPKLGSKVKKRTLGKVVIGTIFGDIHDIGKTLVAAMLSAEGFEVFDLGHDVPIETFISKALEVDADLICISSLLTTTMVGQKKLIDRLIEQGLRNRFKVLVGGAPVTKKWVEEIGADGTAENAVEAVRLAKQLIKN